MAQPMDLGMDEFFNFAEASYQEYPALVEASGNDSNESAVPSPQSSDENYLPPEIWETFGFKEEEPGAKLEYSNFTKWIPCFSRPKQACAYCRSRHLECWFTYEGQSDCSACKALFRPCSFTVEQHPDVLMDTLHTVQEDVVQDAGAMTGIKALRCFDRTPMDNPLAFDDERPSRKTSTRFSRDATMLLKKWVDQHREHPYPTEEQKEELRQLTGLNIGQVSNWFANFRRRTKQRSRGVSPSIRSPGWSSSSSEGIPIPAKRGIVFEGKTWDVMNPLDRWRASPPENEPASVSAIVSAVAQSDVDTGDVYRESSLSRRNSRRDITSSGGSGSYSINRAPSISSLETPQSESQLSSGSFSNLSLTSSRSHQSRGSGIRKDRRRRRRSGNVVLGATTKVQNRPFQCTFCTDSFRTKYDWMRHEKSLHLSLEKWICSPLGAVITCSSSGNQMCVYCGEIDPTVEHIEAHNVTSCSEKPIDQRSFYRKDHLRQHLRLVHGCKMIPSMESWKAETTYIKSRCGFCDTRFTTWSERCDHLAKHYKAGAKMKEWRGCRGFDEEVARHVTNAMPPFLIGNEANSPVPFSATNEASFQANTIPLSAAFGEGMLALSAPKELAMWNQSINCSASIVPGTDVDSHMMGMGLTAGAPMLSNLQTFDLTGSTQMDLSVPPMHQPRISTCWEILTLRLGQFVQEKIKQGELITDEMLQRQARWTLYESDDTWNQTAADNPEWLELFKKAHGLPSSSMDENIDLMEDLGMGIGELSFDALLQDSSWDIRQDNIMA